MNGTRIATLLVLVTVAACTNPEDPDRGSCVRGSLSMEGTVSSSLDTRDCELRSTSSTRYHEEFNVQLQQGQRYVFTMRAESFTPSLELRSASDSLLTGGVVDALDASARVASLVFVAQQSGAYKLRASAVGGGTGSYSLASRANCGGSSEEIYGSATLSTTGTISASDCEISHYWLPQKSARVDLYVLYLGRGESKEITVSPQEGSSIAPVIYVRGVNGLAFHEGVAYGWTPGMLTVENTSSRDALYVLAVGGSAATPWSYTMTVEPSF